MIKSSMRGAIALSCSLLNVHGLSADEILIDGSKMLRSSSGVRVYYDLPSIFSATSEAAQQAWLGRHHELSGVAPRDLRLKANADRVVGPYTTFVYEQVEGGLPVEGARLQMTTRSEVNGASRVIVAQSALMTRKLQPENKRISVAELRRIISNIQGGMSSQFYQEPELVVVFRDAEGGLLPQPRRAWKVQLMGLRPEVPFFKSLFIDSETGDLLLSRDEVVYHEYSGQVSAHVLEGLSPYVGSESLTESLMPHVTVDFMSEPRQSLTTDENGRFSFMSNSLQPTIRAEIRSSLFDVWDYMATPTPLSLTRVGYPGDENDFVFNPEMSEASSSAVSLFESLNRTRDYVRARSYALPGLEAPLLIRANVNSQCNAYFTPGRLTFYRSGANCYNTGYSTIAAHEYGHHLVHSLGLAQGAFGEGVADSLAMFVFNTPVVGRLFYKDGRDLRVPHSAYVKYPCAGGVHHCGQVLGGVWWEILTSFTREFHGGAEMARQLHLTWLSLTAGGLNGDSLHPGSAIEVLMADDDDGYLGNGTPHGVQICRAFARHDISCPSLGEVSLAQNLDREIRVNPRQMHEVRIPFNVSQNIARKPKARLYFKERESPLWEFKDLRLDRAEIVVRFPEKDCGTELEYYVELTVGSRMRATFPELGSQQPAKIFVATFMRVLGAYKFGTGQDREWSAFNENAEMGGWVETPPVNDFIGPYVDTDGSGFYWCSTDIQQPHFRGRASLISPPFPVVSGRTLYAEFDYLARHRFPQEQDFDFLIYDGSVAVTDPLDLGDTSVTWQKRKVKLAAGAEDSFRSIGFNIRSDTAASIFRVAIDHVRIRELSCATIECELDVSEDGRVDGIDMSYFLRYYEFGSSRADFNMDGQITLEDLTEYMAAFQRGC